MKKLLVLAFALLPVLAQAGTKDGDYNNHQVGYYISYPKSFVPEGESDAGDGQEFYNDADDATLVVYGHFNVLDEKLKTIYATELKTEGLKVTYQTYKPNWFVISGTKNDQILYEKVVFKDDTIVYVKLTYPQDKAAKYNAITKQVAGSLKVSKDFLYHETK